MTPAKLDTTRSYGHVFGHESASYEQDGKLFSGDKCELATEPAKRTVPVKAKVQEVAEAPQPMPKAQAFLLNLLNDTAMSKTNVVKESTIVDLSWDDVQEAAHELGVVTYKMGKSKIEMWKFTDDSEA
jgi:hypothetical protein